MHAICPRCHREFSAQFALNQHCRDKSDHHYCELCCRLFGTEVALVQHKENSSAHRSDADSDDDASSQSSIHPTDLDEFFATYPTFPYDRTRPVKSQFNAMCTFLQWGTDKRSRAAQKDAYAAFQDSLVHHFNVKFGKDVDDQQAWVKLCEVLEIHPIPEDVESCREVVSGTHVNIVDLVDPANLGRSIHRFTHVRELSEYTIEEDKYFPRNHAKAGGVLQYLLREIIKPPPDGWSSWRALRKAQDEAEVDKLAENFRNAL